MSIVCFCADDFALNPQINQAIFQLAEKGSIQATSCMTQSPYWRIDGSKLKTYASKIDIGLHFNLTHDFDNQTFSYPLPQLMLRAWTHQLETHKIRETLLQQWSTFIEIMGHPPHFIDGHQHVHQFPVIRDVLIDFLKEQQFNGWIRSLSHTVKLNPIDLKSHLLQCLGASKLERLCIDSNLYQNRNFAGIYNFSKTDYSYLCKQWFKQAKQQLLIMCHPSIGLSDTSDSILDARIQEYNYLNSDQFINDCFINNIQLSRIGLNHAEY